MPIKEARTNSRHTEKIGNTDCQLLALIPVTQQQRHGRELASFEEAQQDARHYQRTKGFNETRAEADDAPTERDQRDDPIELESFDEDGRRKLCEYVEDVKDRDCRLHSPRRKIGSQ